MWALIGTRTTRERKARGQGITVCAVQPDGSLQARQVLGGMVNPSYLVASRDGHLVYTVHGDGNAISLLDFDRGTGRIALRRSFDAQLRNPVHLALDRDERHLLVSSHLTGELVVIALAANGSPQSVVQRVALPGPPGPHRVEQPFSKPHFNPFDPSGRFVVVPDKGLDRIFVFTFDEGQLAPAAEPFVQTREGAGPRGVAFHPREPWMYAVGELDSTVTAYALDSTSGRLVPRQWLTTLPESFTGNSRAAAIAIDPAGRHLYASNRGCDTIEVYAIAATSGLLRHLQSRPSEGRTPRFFTPHPDGHTLYVLNEDSDTIVQIAIDPVRGELGGTRAVLPCASPVCLVFVG